MHVLLNTTWSVKATEKVNERSKKTMEYSTQKVRPNYGTFKGTCWMRKCHFLIYKNGVLGLGLHYVSPNPKNDPATYREIKREM